MKRLLPLYVAIFFQGFVLWYAIEKLFMRQIGFDDASIGVMVAILSAVMLIVETPSGILADRWSRKGVLVLAGIALAISSLIGGLSQDMTAYFVAAGLWGIFFALYSGTNDSIVYDTLLEEGKDTGLYDRYYGRVKVVDSVALVIGSVLGGLAAAQLGIRGAYFLTIPMALLSVVALLVFREPRLHKQHEQTTLAKHVKETFGAVVKEKSLVLVMMMLVTLSALGYLTLEFSQLWWIALAIPVLAFGPANALLLSTIGIGGLAASFLKMHRYAVVQLSLAFMLASAVGLVVSRQPLVTVVCQCVLSVGFVGLTVVFTRFLHDSLESRVRAGAASAVSTMARIVMLPFALLFGFLSKEVSVFAASLLFVVPLLLCFPVVARLFAYRKNLRAVTADDAIVVEEYQK